MSKNSKKWLIGTGIVAVGAAAVGAGIRGISHYFLAYYLAYHLPLLHTISGRNQALLRSI